MSAMESETNTHNVSAATFELGKSILHMVDSYNDNKLLVERKKADYEDLDNALRVKMVPLQGQYSRLKRTLREQKAKQLFLECLATGNVPEHSQTVEENKTVSKNVQEQKSVLADIKIQLEDRANQLQSAYDEFTTDLNALTENIRQSKSKIGDGAQQQQQPLDDVCSEIQELEKRLAVADEEEQALDQQLQMHTSEVSALRAEVESLQGSIDGHQVALERLTAEETWTKREQPDQDKHLNWCRDTLALLEAQSGLRLKSHVENSVTVEILPPGGAPADHQGAALELTMVFALRLDGMHALRQAKVNIESLDVSRIIEEAVLNDDLLLLITQLQVAWHRHQPVHIEVERLRSRYALDWLHKQGQVKVLCGSDASILCTLTLEPGYPQHGHVTLVDASGLPSDLSMSDLKPESPDASLTDWLEYLHERLGGARDTTMDMGP